MVLCTLSTPRSKFWPSWMVFRMPWRMAALGSTNGLLCFFWSSSTEARLITNCSPVVSVFADHIPARMLSNQEWNEVFSRATASVPSYAGPVTCQKGRHRHCSKHPLKSLIICTLERKSAVHPAPSLVSSHVVFSSGWQSLRARQRGTLLTICTSRPSFCRAILA